MNEIKITAQEQNQRFDKYLLKYFNNVSKAFIYKMLRKKRIKLNSKKASGNEILKDGDLVSMYLSCETINKFAQEKAVKKTDQNFTIVYEDKNILICSKPSGLCVHPNKNNPSNTLNDQLLYYLYQKNEYKTDKTAVFKPAICNRLDTNTSGIVVMGKTLASVQDLNRAFAGKEIDKYYLCVVKGRLEGNGEIKGYHKKNSDNTVEIYDSPADGLKEIKTLYNAIACKDGMTLLKLKLITGKSHQIRASLKKAGYPVAGDRKYGDAAFNAMLKKRFGLENQLLHCCEIIFKQKNSSIDYLYGQSFFAEPPAVIKKIIDIFYN